MSYAQTVEPHHKQMFSDNVRMVAQQLKNPIMDAVTVMPCSGEAHSIADLVGALEPIQGEDYSQTNPQNVPNRARRWLVRPTVVESGQIITKEEQFDQAMNPTSILFQTHIKAVMRGKFDRVLGVRKQADGTFAISGGGIMGVANEGKQPGTTSDLPSGNFIAVDEGDTGATGLNLTKLRLATEGMEIEEFGLEDPDDVHGLITPKQKTDLINLAVATGSNLNPFDVDNIREGRPGKLMGINWKFTNRLPKDANGYRLIPIWTKSNVIAGEWQSTEGLIFNDTSKRNLPQILVDDYTAASRIEDEGVRIIRCSES